VGVGVVLLALAGCSRQEAADWKQATLADSAEAYQLFLQQHPHSAEATQAQARIGQLAEQRDWQIASAGDTRDSYQLFLTQHPDSKWAQEARIRVENFAQAGVSGGAALSATATPSSAAGPAEAAATAPVGNAPAATAAAAGAASAAAPAAPAAAAPVISSAQARHGEHRGHRPTHATLAHAARHTAHRLARATPHTAHGAHGAHPVLGRDTQPTRLVQLGAFRSRASAVSEWRTLSAHFATLKGLQPRVVAAHSRSGRVYRLQVRVSSAAQASGLCATLRRHARPCMRVAA